MQPRVGRRGGAEAAALPGSRGPGTADVLTCDFLLFKALLAQG